MIAGYSQIIHILGYAMRYDADIYILTHSEPNGNVYEGYFTDLFSIVSWIIDNMTDDEMFSFGQLERELQRATDVPIRCVVYMPTVNDDKPRYSERWYTIYPIHLDSQ